MRERVLSWPVGVAVDPEAAFAGLWGDAEHAFWLDTGGPEGPGVSYLGAAPRALTAEGIRAAGDDVLVWLRDELDSWDVDASDAGEGFATGIVGWLGYELYEDTLGLTAPGGRRYPTAVLMPVDRALAVEGDGTARLVARGTTWEGELAAWRDETLAALGALAAPPGPAPVAKPPPVAWRYSEAEYLAMIRACKHAIADGDAYVLCLTTEASVPGAFDPFEVYRRVRRTSPSHHGAYLRSGGVALLSASPEQFLSVDRSGWVTTRPIKGTRPRGATAVEDAALAEELRTSEKERAENVMIVDLMRNDLSRVCVVGSVEVTRLLEVETYPHVHQLVSTVGGRLAAGFDAVDAVHACFPAGSMTGAPKYSAVDILRRLEERPRGLYSGAFGYFGADGAVDLAMTIRSIVIDGDGATIGTGGGITALSVPEEEVAEVRLKAAALLDALG